MTQTEKILALVKRRPGISAYQVSTRLDLVPANVSSIMVKLVTRGVLRREANKGPRGGFAYYYVRPTAATNKTTDPVRS